MRDAVPVKGGCGDYSFAVVEMLRRRGIRACNVVGSYWRGDVGVAGVHHWIELPSGEWIDPTSEQHDLPPALVLVPSDPRRADFKGIAVNHLSTVEHIEHDLVVAAEEGIPVRFHSPVVCTPETKAPVEELLRRVMA